MECLETEKICPTRNLKCKKCKFDDCRRVLEMIDYDEKRVKAKKINLIKLELPEQCKNCSFLEIIDINKKVVKCPFRIKKCLIEQSGTKHYKVGR